MKPATLLNVLKDLSSPRVLVLGDLILDRYTRGNAERVSQEAPILVLLVDEREELLGGAANVCHMLRELECEVACAGIVGADEAGNSVRQLLNKVGIGCDLLFTDASRPTTVKERFIGRVGGLRPGQMLRVDHEVRTPLSPELTDQLLDKVRLTISDFDVLLISDYAKGVCTAAVTQAVIKMARHAGKPVLVDPLRGGDYQQYRGATLLKPNRVETELATGQKIVSSDDAIRAGSHLCDNLDIDLAVITLDRQGMALVHRDGRGQVVPTRARSVYDITGAGDMVLAMLAAAIGGGATVEEAVHLANIAAGLEVERAGVAVISKQEIADELSSGARTGQGKVFSLEQAAAWAQEQRRQGQRVVFTNGCFDLLHVGHVSYLAEAAALGDQLVVGINSDASVRRLKGPSRPVINEVDRAAVLAALSCVSSVVVFEEDTPHQLLRAIRPDVLVKGGTYSVDEVVGKEVVEAYGGQVCVVGVVDGVSTTEILESATKRQSLPVAPNRRVA
ncbi:MAG TPA: D-glycero-beta-D-manno-heptose 1-phosphate adenylyltransferase [Pirellulaceae bacterium]|nr:D-glycero-beta-D-manno-heptose 1-phosphate adenylyltransferase [Pirellulaceae bacterium]